MKRVAIFTDNLNVGGIQKSLINLLNNFDFKKNDIKIDLFLFEKNNFYDDLIPKNINVIYLKKYSFFTKFIYFDILKKLKKTSYKYDNYDVAIDFDSYQNHTALGVINTKSRKKIMWIHNDVEEKSKGEFKYKILHTFFKAKYKYFDTFVGVSKGVIEPFKKANHINNKDFRVIPNYIDTTEIIDKSQEHCELDVSEKNYNLVTVGRLCYQKGYDILINYMQEIVKKNKNIHLYMIGDGPLKDELIKQINSLNLTKNITLLGNQKNPYKYMKKMDGFVLTSRYEGQGMVILEAKTIGLQIFIPKHLEKYVDDVSGCDNIVNDISNAKRKAKEIDMLTEYNDNIMSSLQKLLKK